MQNPLKLSIIVPVYNVEQYLERCINSLLNQDIDKSEYEIILVNDGSTDRSYDIAKRFEREYANICLLSQENKGQAAARNNGMDVAKGKYIMFVDSDDKLFPDVLDTILSTAIEKRLDVCSYRMLYYDSIGNTHIGGMQPFDSETVFTGPYSLTHGADIGSVCISLYSSELLRKANLRFFEGIYHEDVDFTLRMYAFINRMMFLDKVVYSYTYNSDSTDRKKTHNKTIKQIKDECKIAKHIKDFGACEVEDMPLREFYLRHSNSLIVSDMLIIMKSKELLLSEKNIIHNKMKALGLYPVKGRTLSWKTTALLPFLNHDWLYKKLLKLSSLHIK